MCAYHANMERKNVHLTKTQIKELGKLSRKTGAPVAELIRRAVDRFIKLMKGETK